MSSSSESSPEPSVPLMIDAPLPGAHNPTRWTVQLGIRLTVGFCIVAALLGSVAAYEAISYARTTNAAQKRTDARLVKLEAQIDARGAVRDQERDEILAQIDRDRQASRLASCSILGSLLSDKTLGPAVRPFYELAKCIDLAPTPRPEPSPSR